MKSLQCLFFKHCLAPNIRSQCQVAFFRFSAKHTTLTKAFDSSLGAFTKNWNQSNCQFFTVFTGTRLLWWLHSSQPWAMVCVTALCVLSLSTKLNVNFFNFFKRSASPACVFGFIYSAFCGEAVFWCVTVSSSATWLKWKFMHSLITSSHGSPTLSTLGRKDRCWICSIPSPLCLNLV